MVSKTVTYGALALAASEMTGVTNFTGGSSGGQGPLQMPDIKLPELSAPNVSLDTSSSGQEAVMAALAQGNDSNAGAGMAQALAGMQEQQSKLLETVLGQTQNQGSGPDYTNPEYWRNQVPDMPGMPGDGDGNNGSDNGSGNSRTQDGLDLQDYGTPGDGNMGFGDIAAITGEAGASAGETVNSVVETGSKAGNTWAQTVKALSGQEYNTENTFANNGQDETRRLYQGKLVGGEGSNFLGRDGVVNNLDGNVTEAVGRTFDNKEGGGVVDGIKETFGL